MKGKTSETVTEPPTIQKFERLKTIEKEHKDALERAVSLNVPHAVDSAEEETAEKNEGEEASDSGNNNVSSSQSKSSDGRSNWDEVVEKLLKKSKTVELNQQRDTNVLP